MYNIFINDVEYKFYDIIMFNEKRKPKNKDECISVLFNYFHKEIEKIKKRISEDYIVIAARKYGKAIDLRKYLSLLELETELIKYVFSNGIYFKFQDVYNNIKIIIKKFVQ